MTSPAPSSPLPLTSRVCIQNVPVCAFKTFPCVPATCPHVLYMWACYTRERFERTHGDVLNVHTGVFSVPHHNTHHTTHQHPHTNTHTPTPTHQHTHTPTHIQHAHNTSQTHNKPRHHTTPHTAPTHGTYTSHTTHNDTSRSPHTTPQPVHIHTTFASRNDLRVLHTVLKSEISVR